MKRTTKTRFFHARYKLRTWDFSDNRTHGSTYLTIPTASSTLQERTTSFYLDFACVVGYAPYQLYPWHWHRTHLLREYIFEHSWLSLIRPYHSQRLRSMTRLRNTFNWTIFLHVRKEEIHIQVMFEIFRDLAAPVLLSTSFSDRIIKGISRSIGWKSSTVRPLCSAFL